MTCKYTLRPNHVVTEESLEAIGGAASDIRNWPVPEYADWEGRPCWLWEDLELWFTYHHFTEVQHDRTKGPQ
jgi:hypothetical protein